MDITYSYDLSVKTQKTVNRQYDVLVNVPKHNIRWQSLQIGINSKTLSDTYSGVTYQQVADLSLDDTLQGTILDYSYNFKVETLTVSGSQVSVNGRYNSDKLLYTDYQYRLDNRDALGTHNGKLIFMASTYFEAIAANLGLTPHWYCFDWPVKAGTLPRDCTYQQFLQGLFGWLSDLPHIDINVFIRGTDIYVVQRDWEKDLIDDRIGRVVSLSDAAHVKRVPAIEQTRIRTEMAVTAEWPVPSDAVTDDDPEPFTGTIQFGDATLTYVNGYLTERVEGNRRTVYAYTDIDGARYLSLETVTDSDAGTADKTEYTYANANGVLYLAVEKRYTGGDYTGGVPDYTDAVIITTTHSPLGNGWYGITTHNEDTDETTTSLSQGGPASTASQYTIDKSQQALNGLAGTQRELLQRILARLFGTPVINTNWPVDTAFGRNLIAELADETDWLNNKIQETITMDMVGLDHVVDFTDLVLYRGHYYCLQGNTVNVTPGGITQTITVVRWFAGNDTTPTLV